MQDKFLEVVNYFITCFFFPFRIVFCFCSVIWIHIIIAESFSRKSAHTLLALFLMLSLTALKCFFREQDHSPHWKQEWHLSEEHSSNKVLGIYCQVLKYMKRFCVQCSQKASAPQLRRATFPQSLWFKTFPRERERNKWWGTTPAIEGKMPAWVFSLIADQSGLSGHYVEDNL